jgi:hypothetical protein
MSDLFSPQELAAWQASLEEANRHNVLCHCRDCDAEWITSKRDHCTCGSSNVESILCWQFPDD